MADVVLAVLAAGLSAALAGVVRRLALAQGALDHPAPNKPHRAATPTLGGLAVALPFLGLLWATVLLRGGPLPMTQLVGYTAGALIVLALGVYDDLHGCGAGMKLTVQTVAALFLVASGFGIEQVTNPLNDAVPLAGLGLPLTVLWVAGLTNAVNLIDGLDGLAASVVLIAAATLFTIAVRFDEPAVALPAALLAGGLAGFMPANRPPARLFLGDTGSLFLGYTVAAISLLHNRKGTLTVTLLLPVVLMAFPLLDTALAFGRRVLRLQHPFQGDTEHLHHRLLRLGLSPAQTLAAFCGVGVALGLAAHGLAGLPKQLSVVATGVLALVLFVLLGWLIRRERRHRPPGRRPGRGSGR
jgi:UDP-GlcNAc:undecaprenyl-phosphate GlcNAc-1-phosphate transferase